jgi:hypothetical protein
MMLIGYSNNHKSYILVDVDTDKVRFSRDVVVDEEVGPFHTSPRFRVTGVKIFSPLAGRLSRCKTMIQTNQRVNLSSWGENKFSHSASGPQRRCSFHLFLFFIFLFWPISCPGEGGFF